MSTTATTANPKPTLHPEFVKNRVRTFNAPTRAEYKNAA